jgi:GDP-D-mannose dehydratase
MRVLITGITGFVGSHLTEFALGKGAEVFGTYRWRSRLDNIQHLLTKIRLIDCDLRDAISVRNAVKEAKPDWIFHLAAQSFVPASWTAPADTMHINVIGTINLFEAVRQLDLDCRILNAGSSEEYGLQFEHELPIKETNPLRPLSPYAVSKVAQDLLGWQYHRSYGMFIVRTRAFNHSVTRWTPVLLRDDRTGLIDIRYIGELRCYKPKGYMSGKRLENGTVVWDFHREPISVWANGKWSKIRRLYCHPLNGDRVLRIVSSGGIVEVTGDHSIIASNGMGPEVMHARDLLIGDKLNLVPLPVSELMVVPEEVAWFLGFFAAEGTIPRGRRAKIVNKDPELLERCRDILLRYFGKHSTIHRERDGLYLLRISKPLDFSRWLYPQVYASDGNKRVPMSILNAQPSAKLAFLEGYNAGDGLQRGYGSYAFKNFKTKSPILAMGLCYLVAATTGQRFCLNTEVRDGRVYYSINLNSDNPEHANWGKHLEIPDEVVKKVEQVDYDGEVWDIETDDGVFHAGIGLCLVHNSGPRRPEQFVDSGFAWQIARIEAGLQEPVIYVGNLEAKRDFTDVRDIVRAYWLALEKGEPGEVYNICSGKAWSVREVLEMLLGMAEVKVEVRQDPAKMRPSDVPVLIGDSTKFREKTGWAPQIPYEQTLRDMLDYWRSKFRSG